MPGQPDEGVIDVHHGMISVNYATPPYRMYVYETKMMCTCVMLQLHGSIRCNSCTCRNIVASCRCNTCCLNPYNDDSLANERTDTSLIH